MDTLLIRKMEQKDLKDVLKIYQEGIDTGMATFQTEVPSECVWDEGHHATLRFVAEVKNRVVGWIAISPISTRAVYCGVGEVSVYISTDNKGKGIASKLFGMLIDESEKEGFWTLQSSIFAINSSSIQLHKKMGFRIVGTREKIAQLHGKWHDTVIMEKRSIGIVNVR
ncbi:MULTISPECIES: GNAT family N-acetyltransferase [unclassified Lysinibacillus]|uniref:GNAT family N-acetyltransferase n=1 Tax=unclassified Lysinibacillus TaxID=2636778 RepID=UPI0008826A1D|nr:MULTISPECIES: GNAT family N-acetyltransferase [unclassified Lysinibacillus]SCY34227.1 phosphinothricin acetyltransferase [Lysinibacillus sp. SG9]SDB17659.1 phosphinothricin acetyltransferase [Lysinibacillus sp. TC-37]SFS65197.1 phosphinothricin acetyltransferase [Lysinibacillus sp. SG55]